MNHRSSSFGCKRPNCTISNLFLGMRKEEVFDFGGRGRWVLTASSISVRKAQIFGGKHSEIGRITSTRVIELSWNKQ